MSNKSITIPLLSGGPGGSGTVTLVSIVTANGISGVVATNTTTPAITLSLNAIQPGTTFALGSDATGDVYYNGGAGVITRLGIGTNGQVLTLTAGIPSWATATGGVTSVTGTLDRIITSPTTGAVVVNISPNYVGQASIVTLGTITTGIWTGTAIADANIATSYIKADGTRALTGNWAAGAFSGTFNSVIIGSAANTIQGATSIIGGTAVGDGIIFIPTTGIGTLTAAAQTFKGGTNGGTILGTVYNNGNWNIGNAVTTGQRLFQIGQDNSYISIGSVVGDPDFLAMYFNQPTPDLTNWGFSGNVTDTQFNGANNVYFNVGGTSKLRIQSTTITVTNAVNIAFSTITGTKIGTGITQKLGVYGATPIVQRSGAAQVAVATTAATSTTPFGYTTAAQADGVITLLNELRAWAVAQGFIKGAV